MSIFKIGADRENKIVSLSIRGSKNTHNNLSSGQLILNGEGRYKFARILSFHEEEGKTFAFCQNIIAKTLRPNGKCGWFSIDVEKIQTL